MCAFRFLIVSALLIVSVAPALAEKRVALIIGNGNYTSVSRLHNPSRDAIAVEAMFKAAGFDYLRRVENLGAQAMRRTLRDFAGQVHNADIAVIFYAGHGIEVSGSNYLIPVDAVLERDIDVEDETIALDRLSQILEPAKRLRLIILDACRDNPFLRSMKRTVASRSIGRGLAKVDVLTSDTLVAYAARAGSTAADGEGSNSPYTAGLVKHLATPGLDVRLALGRVRDDVLRATDNKQEPFVYGSLGGSEVALVPERPKPVAAPPPPVPPSPPAVSNQAALEWQDIKATSNIAVLQGFIERHKSNQVYAPLAQSRVEEIEQQRAREAAEAERQRVALLDQQKRTEAEARKRAEAEAKAKAEREIFELVRGYQTELTRLGCYKGKVDGAWGGAVVEAIGRYNAATKSSLGTSSPSKAALGDLINRGGTACPIECGKGETLSGGKCVAATPSPPPPPPPQKATAVEKRNSVSEACEAWQKCEWTARAHSQGGNAGPTMVFQKCGRAPSGCAGR